MRLIQHAVRCRNAGHEGGTVLLLVTFSLILLFGLAALVFDLGRMYVIKTQLQNAADAGALRGAKELNGTAAGLSQAENRAKEGALTNEFHLVANPLTADDITVRFARHPFPSDWEAADAECHSNPHDCYFVRVETRAQGIASFFAGIIGIDTNAAKAMAVAGRNHVEITPIAMCAIDLQKCPDQCTPSSTEHCECGYERGKAYKVTDVNPIGPGTMFWIDPVAKAPPCNVTSAEAFRPYVCQGRVSFGVAIGGTVYTNTGISDLILTSLDSRFGDYPTQGQCDPRTAPPDTNVKEFAFEDLDVKAWMNPEPTRQAACLKNPGGMPLQFDSQGVVWAASRPEANPIAGRSVVPDKYPAVGTPYSQTSGRFFQAPTGAGASYATPGRRVMNLIIVDCPVAGGVCRPATVKQVGRFLLTRRASTHFQQASCGGSGGDKENSSNQIYVEFMGSVPLGSLNAEIKLYR